MPDEWWETPYRGGPMVGPGFIRPLYPPDAEGYGASAAGSDVVAIKRTVWRLGRWPGPASAFDMTFSNAFSHGRSGNVSESGLAGVQRQGNLDDSGYMGERTYNLLRSALIPDGLPHAGEHGMDPNAQTILAEFAKAYRAPPPTKTTVRDAALAKAVTQIGVKESPAGSNLCKYTDWYDMVGPWCAMFATWAYELGSASGSPSFVRGTRYAYCPYIVADARAKRYGLSLTNAPIPGDLVVYNWDGTSDEGFDHVGLFDSGDQDYWTAIEGNTSTSNQSNGGEVMRRSRNQGQAAAVVFVRVAEP